MATFGHVNLKTSAKGGTDLQLLVQLHSTTTECNCVVLWVDDREIEPSLSNKSNEEYSIAFQRVEET